MALIAGNANLLWRRLTESPEMVRNPELKLAPRSETINFHELPARRQEAPLDIPPVKKTLAKEVAASKPDIPAVPAESVERTVDEAGNLVLRGKTVGRFQSGQSLTTVHIAFRPPFVSVPEFSSEIGAEANALVRARPPAVFRYGARMELKRTSGIDAPLEVSLTYLAVARARSTRAA
jgi:hypothetical protein